MRYFLAQATVAPNSGASNAQDFQPGTRNPQGNSSSELQQTTPLQDTSDVGQLLNQNTNTRIIVPTSNSNQSSVTAESSPATNYSLIVGMLLLAVLILAFAHFIRKRGRVRILPLEESNFEPSPDSVQRAKEVSSQPASSVKPTKKAKKTKKHRKHR